MIILSGKHEVILSQKELVAKVCQFKSVHLDLGTGDGKQVYRYAKNNPDTLYIGIDAVKANLVEISSKITKKPMKGGLNNVILVISAIEELPTELQNIANSLTIFLPWGSLLEGLVKPVASFLKNIVFVAKNSTSFEFVITYSELFESSEIQRRQLPDININYFNEMYRATLKELGLIIENIEVLDNEDIKLFESQWAKRLAYGRKRDFFRIQGHVKK
ncbi:MAG: 16S rRNA (adenine(1408)-N(1))-methyltransferase NpmA [Deltaproteobacteria bacterium]|nr:16S rRNA (adenine(1408)-N(1))-methyltransferase NpmA [Deltaproteobacteria bacterium]